MTLALRSPLARRIRIRAPEADQGCVRGQSLPQMADGLPPAAAVKVGFAPPAAKTRGPVPVAAPRDGAAGHNNGGAATDFVTAIDGGELASSEERKQRPALVVAALPNTFETGKGKRPRGVRLHCDSAPRSRPGVMARRVLPEVAVRAQNHLGFNLRDAKRAGVAAACLTRVWWSPQVPSFIPEASAEVQGGERFEKAVANEQAQAADVQYGLNKRVRSQGAAGTDEPAKAAPTERSFVERALEDRNAAETAQLRDDLARLPDASALDAYEAMPVECFGEAMLRGMGWTDGGPVGRNAAAVVKPIEYVPRPQLLGLGAALPAPLPPGAAPGRPGKATVEHKMLPVGPDGRVRNVRNLDEQLVKRTVAGAVVGKRMAIGWGTHAGLVGEVLAIGTDKKSTLRLDISGERVTVRTSDLVEVGSQEAEKAQAQRHGGSGGGGAGERQNTGDKQRSGDMAPPPSRPADGSRPWLTPRVRVRVVSQRLNGGAQYLKKGVILDVVTPTECTIRLDDGGKMVDNVPQRALETVLPKQKGAPLLVVSGRYRGQHATLVGKDSGAGTAHVCLEMDLSVVTLQLDEVAEFV